jgi:hypothetical protein
VRDARPQAAWGGRMTAIVGRRLGSGRGQVDAEAVAFPGRSVRCRRVGAPEPLPRTMAPPADGRRSRPPCPCARRRASCPRTGCFV